MTCSGGVSDFDAYRLLQGFDNKTVESGRALWQLSRRALEVAPVRAVLEQSRPRSPPSLEASPEGQGFLRLLHDYLQTWGQRGDRWGWSFPSWIEDPTPVIKTLKDYVRQPDRDLEAEAGGTGCGARAARQRSTRAVAQPPTGRE